MTLIYSEGSANMLGVVSQNEVVSKHRHYLLQTFIRETKTPPLKNNKPSYCMCTEVGQIFLDR